MDKLRGYYRLLLLFSEVLLKAGYGIHKSFTAFANIDSCIFKRLADLVFASLLVIILASSSLAYAKIIQQNDNQLSIEVDIADTLNQDFKEIERLKFYFDKEEKVKISDLLKSQYATEFESYNKAIQKRLENPSIFWINFRLINEDNSSLERNYYLSFGSQLIKSTTLHIYDADNNLQTLSSNSFQSFNNRPYPHHSLILPVTIPPGSSSVYLKIQADKFNLNELSIFSQEKLNEKLQREQLSLGVYVGIITALIIYSLMLYNAVREYSYIYFTVFMVSSLIYQILINRLFLTYFPDYSGANDINLAVLVFIISMCSAVQFSRQFLRLGYRSKPMDNLLLGISAIFLSLVPILMTGQTDKIYAFFDYLLCILLLTLTVISIKSWQQSFSSAKYFVFGWFTLLISEITYKASKAGVAGIELLSQDIMYYSYALVSLLLSGALVHRVSQIKKEKEFAQLEALKQAESNNRLQENFVKHLEDLVFDRTKELRANNAKLVFLTEQQKKFSEILTDLFDISIALHIKHDIREIISSSLFMLKKTYPDAGFCIAIYDRSKQEVTEHNYCSLLDREYDLVKDSFSFLKNHKSFELHQWIQVNNYRDEYISEPNSQWKLFDMKTKEGSQVGYIFAKLPKEVLKDNSFINIINIFSIQISTAIENRRLSNQLEKIAATDSLTGLNNRAAFDSAMDQLQSSFSDSKKSSILLIIDVNGLKTVNDNLGHLVGDKLITETAKILQKCCDESDLISRIGGDEFAILRTSATKIDGIHLKEKIKNNCLPINLEQVSELTRINKKIELSVSIGVSCTVDHNDIEALKKAADAAMYQDKKEYYKTHYQAGRTQVMNELMENDHHKKDDPHDQAKLLMTKH